MLEALNSAITTKALIVLLLPLFTFWFLLLFGRVINKYRGYTATVIMLVALGLSVFIFFDTWPNGTFQTQWNWFQMGEYSFSIGIRVDHLSALMLLIVTLVSFLVHLFSIEYLRGDKNFEKYFAYLGLFTFSMLGIILMDNLLCIFMFWELVGLSSYLLIGFWHKKEEAAFASKKAFIVNRVGDAGFIFGLLCCWMLFSTFDLSEMQYMAEHPGQMFSNVARQTGNLYGTDNTTLWLQLGAGLGILLGAIGKSAQFPLSIWLPNAMEGPTPVSALIHAATMVAAGVYLLARVIFMLPEDVMNIIAIVGTITALMGAFTALTQNDIKRVLAFSTISQLGYMFIGIGVGSLETSLFHLLTHAFFKACLFLSAGAVIHSMHELELDYQKKGVKEGFDPQDMRNMGGLRKRMPVTFLTYLISALALAGLPLFSGFLSKDAIITSAWDWASGTGAENLGGLAILVPLTALIASLFTAIYMGRQIMLIFFGEFRLGQKIKVYKDAFKDVIETPFLMRIPTILLAFLSLSFVFSINPFDASGSWFMDGFTKGHIHSPNHTMIATLSALIAIAGLGVTYMMYSKRNSALMHLKNKVFGAGSFLHRLSFNNWYLDELYTTSFVRVNQFLARLMSWLDTHIVDAFVNTLGRGQYKIGTLTSWIDRYIIDAFVNVFGRAQYVLSILIGWFDKNIVDGIVHLVTAVTGFTGSFLRIAGGGSIQGYIFWSGFILMIILYVILF